MIAPERIATLNDQPIRAGRYVLYSMQASIRTEWNHALEYAAAEANRLRLPLVVLFGITDNYPEANERHYAFMLQALPEIASALAERGIRFVVRHQSPELAAVELANEAALVVVDRHYVRIQRHWNAFLAKQLPCSLVQVESNVVVPVEVASTKDEWAAYTFRPKVTRQIGDFLQPVETVALENRFDVASIEPLDPYDVRSIMAGLKVDRSVQPVTQLIGGTAEAKRLLELFIASKLNDYDEKRNDPTTDYQSHLSPYLEFGHISSPYIARRIMESSGKGKAAFLEEFIVRRELSMNFCECNDQYDSYVALPPWAKATLAKHARDRREFVYTARQWEAAETHDPYWNAAQLEMVKFGKMHGYMRMYWGKKILEWSASPEEAFATALYLNNKYELDGRSPNGFAGVAWCFGKHDRPWAERPVYGMIRYMNANGLKRKFDVDLYVRKVTEGERQQTLF